MNSFISVRGLRLIAQFPVTLRLAFKPLQNILIGFSFVLHSSLTFLMASVRPFAITAFSIAEIKGAAQRGWKEGKLITL